MLHGQIAQFLGRSATALVLAVVVFSANSISAETAVPNLPTAIQALLSGGAVGQSAFAFELAQLQRVYAEHNFQPVWSGSAEALERGRIASGVLARADEHGLEPARYASATPTLADSVGDQAAEADIQLTLDVLRYAHDVRSGRLPPDSIYRDVDLPEQTFDPVIAFTWALRRGDMADFLSALPPAQPEYQRLIAALARYRDIEAHGGWPSIPGDREVKTDGSDPRLDVLMRRLQVEDSKAALPGADPVTAVKRYQRRNGLTADGRVGALTLEMLNVPAAERVVQIVANLERWRWLPRTFEMRYIAVNVPDQSLQLVEDGKSLLTSRVIVGRPQTPTPIFRATVIAVTINPPWNVPHSIAVKEVLPRLRRAPNYLATEGMVLLNGPADDPTGAHIDWRRVSADRFPYQIQQLPADKNALGKLKLELPNRFSVYLHDTPGKAAFERDQRALSHGCIRVQEMLPLAALAMGGDPKVARETLDTQIAAGATVQMPLIEPLPVYVLYWTAMAGEDGSVGFRRDLYRRDSRLNAALRDRLATATPAGAIGGCPYEG
jgi:murein L,D-transpeptidase YcbB/YkuD